MKKIILLSAGIFLLIAVNAQKNKGGGEAASISFAQNQFSMANEFLKSSEIYWALTKNGGTNPAEIESKPVAKFAEGVKRDEKGNIIAGVFRMMTVTPQNNDYPLYYKDGSNNRCYFIGEYIIKIRRAPIATAADVDAMVIPENVYELGATSKSSLKSLDFEKVKSLLKEYYSANDQVIKETMAKTRVSTPAGNTWELKGFKMEAEGKKIAQYVGIDDGKTRHNYLLIREDTIVYTVVRLKDDGTVDALKKWKMYIGVVNHTSPYYKVWPFNNGSQKLYNVMIPITGSSYFVCQEMLSVKDKPELVQYKKLEAVYADEAEANAFLNMVTEIRSQLKTPQANNGAATQNNDSKTTGGFISFKNYDDNLKFKIEGSSSATRMSGSMSIPCNSTNIGKKVFLADNSGKVIRELFVIKEDMCGKYYDFKTGSFVK